MTANTTAEGAAVLTPELVEAIRALLADRSALIERLIEDAQPYQVARIPGITTEQLVMIEEATR